jgi:hypothetical protein
MWLFFMCAQLWDLQLKRPGFCLRGRKSAGVRNPSICTVIEEAIVSSFERICHFSFKAYNCLKVFFSTIT